MPPADGQTGPGVLAACSARRWLARHAAGVKLVRCLDHHCDIVPWTTSACTGLVSCLPALETVVLHIPEPLDGEDFGCLLEALSWCARLTALDLSLTPCGLSDEGVILADVHSDTPPFAKLHRLAKLRSLTKLALSICDDSCTLANVVDAVSPLTGLTELAISLYEPAVVPAALGQLKGLQSLALRGLSPGVFEAGCLDLPRLVSLEFQGCGFNDGDVLPGATALQSLTRIECTGGNGLQFFDPQLVQLPQLQRAVFDAAMHHHGPYSSLATLPADMGLLRCTLRHLCCSGHGFNHFPLALTQLVALECLRVTRHNFAELPAGITALSRLTELSLGRVTSWENFLQEQERLPLDARALGDLSSFPALRKLSFQSCEVKLCESLPGAVRHTSLASLSFDVAHPAPECLLTVLQLGQALKRLGRCSVLRFAYEKDVCGRPVECRVQTLPLFHRFKAATKACGL